MRDDEVVDEAAGRLAAVDEQVLRREADAGRRERHGAGGGDRAVVHLDRQLGLEAALRSRCRRSRWCTAGRRAGRSRCARVLAAVVVRAVGALRQAALVDEVEAVSPIVQQPLAKRSVNALLGFATFVALAGLWSTIMPSVANTTLSRNRGRGLPKTSHTAVLPNPRRVLPAALVPHSGMAFRT